ncbi:hypothetical protein TNCV_2460251 [Trichonephila clavipes]|nr:hypothetical protein TNCV_2460251 [Trichonephila clavipes]
MAFHALFQNISKTLNRSYVWASRWTIYDRKSEECLSNQPVSNWNLGEVQLSCWETFTLRTTEQHKRDGGDHPATLRPELY